jgi:hypothetical protein
VTALSVDDTAPIRLLRPRVSEWAPAACKAVAGLCEQAVGLWPEQFPARSAVFVGETRKAAGVDPEGHEEWQRAAVEVCRQAASVDPDWFCQYWRSVVRSGVRPPAAVTRMLVALDFLRPQGHRSRAIA